MDIVLIIIFSAYGLMLLAFSLAWRRERAPAGAGADQTKLSVVIPVRNEAGNIRDLLEDLGNQSTNSFEVIVVDDESSDETASIVKELAGKSKYPLQLIELNGAEESAVTPKKRALDVGIKASRGEIIVTTDGDCRVSPSWISGMRKAFSDEAVHFVSGPVIYHEGTNLFENLQTLEFASLIGSGASSIDLGYPNICNGANLAFRKASFIQLNGYNGNDHLASGDDEFLLQKFATYKQGGVRFAKDRRAIVKTRAKPTLKEFYHQRKRWTSKLKHHNEFHIWVLSLGVLVVNVSILAALVFAILGYLSWGLFLTVLGLKLVFEGYFVSGIMKFFERKVNWFEFFILELIHPFYITLFGLFTNFGSFKWKGRTYYE